LNRIEETEINRQEVMKGFKKEELLFRKSRVSFLIKEQMFLVERSEGRPALVHD